MFLSLLDFLGAAPRRFSPPWAAALGLAFGFYPGSPPIALTLTLAAAAAGFGIAFGGLAGRPSRLRAVLVLAFALGLAGGAALRRDEAGRAAGAAAGGARVARAKTAYATPADAPGAVPADAPGAVARLRVAGLAGRLEGDSTPTAKGYRSYPVELEALLVEGPGIAGRCSASGSRRLLVREGPVLEAGARLEARAWLGGGASGGGTVGGTAGGGAIAGGGAGPPAFFARAADLRVEAGGRSGAGGPGEALAALRSRLRAGFGAALEVAGGGGASAGLLGALLMGSREALDADEARDWKRAGCAHVLALSGQHLAILAALASFLLGPIVGKPGARLAALLLAFLFVFVAGPGPSLLRSLLMYSIGALAYFVDRPQSGRTVLALAFCLALVFDPESARSLSFELSYLAIAGLVVLGPRCEHLLAPALPPLGAKALAAGLAAQAATMPLLALAFGTLYPAGLLASLAVGPLVAGYMYWGLGAAALAGLFPAAAPLLAPVSRLLHRLVAGTMAFFARWPELAVGDGRAAALLVVLAAAFVYALPHVEHRIRPRGRVRRRSRNGEPEGRRRLGRPAFPEL